MSVHTVDQSAQAGAASIRADDASARKRTARLAGLLYFVMAVLDVLGYMYFPTKFNVAGDPAGTARRILDGELLYRTAIMTALVGQILFIFVVLTLYHLFRDVERRLARVMLVLVCVAVAAEMVTIANKLTPLVLLKADYLSAFTRPQLEALAFASLRWGNNLGQLLTIFWGMWLFPFGLLTIRSGFLPKVLGYLLMLAGIGYVVGATTFIVFPAQLALLGKFMFPLYFGELPIIFWLMIMGARARQPSSAT